METQRGGAGHAGRGIGARRRRPRDDTSAGDASVIDPSCKAKARPLSWIENRTPQPCWTHPIGPARLAAPMNM